MVWNNKNKLTNALIVGIILNKMEAYKLQLAFKDLNQVIDFYRTEIKKKEQNILPTVTAMGVKGMIVSNPDSSVTVTWFFRNFSKFDKFTNAYLNYIMEPDRFTPQARRTYIEIINE